MNLQMQILPAVIPIYLLESNPPVQKDPLINNWGENVVYIGVVLIAIGLVVAVRIFSPRVEHAVIFAFFLSIVLIAFFLIK